MGQAKHSFGRAHHRAPVWNLWTKLKLVAQVLDHISTLVCVCVCSYIVCMRVYMCMCVQVLSHDLVDALWDCECAAIRIQSLEANSCHYGML